MACRGSAQRRPSGNARIPYFMIPQCTPKAVYPKSSVPRSVPQRQTCTWSVIALEKEMAAHSRVLAWRIPGTEEPGGLQSMGPLRVGHK